MVNNLLSIVHDLIYAIIIMEFTEEERNYILGVAMKTIKLIKDIKSKEKGLRKDN